VVVMVLPRALRLRAAAVATVLRLVAAALRPRVAAVVTARPLRAVVRRRVATALRRKAHPRPPVATERLPLPVVTEARRGKWCPVAAQRWRVAAAP
jgi:hypothetical protein